MAMEADEREAIRGRIEKAREVSAGPFMWAGAYADDGSALLLALEEAEAERDKERRKVSILSDALQGSGLDAVNVARNAALDIEQLRRERDEAKELLAERSKHGPHWDGEGAEFRSECAACDWHERLRAFLASLGDQETP